MSMRELIDSWQGTDADLLAALNDKTEQVLTPNENASAGRFGFLGMAKASFALASAFKYAVEQVAAGMAASGQQELMIQATGIRSMMQNFEVGGSGIDFAHEEVRANIQAILTQAGWSQPQIDAVLAFGYTLHSVAELELGRDAVQADIDGIRLGIERDAALTQVIARANAATSAASLAHENGEDGASITLAAMTAWGG